MNDIDSTNDAPAPAPINRAFVRAINGGIASFSKELKFPYPSVTRSFDAAGKVVEDDTLIATLKAVLKDDGSVAFVPLTRGNMVTVEYYGSTTFEGQEIEDGGWISASAQDIAIDSLEQPQEVIQTIALKGDAGNAVRHTFSVIQDGNERFDFEVLVAIARPTEDVEVEVPVEVGT